MFEYHKNKINEIHSIPNNLSVEENLYFRDYYLKDFKYISPDVINLNKNKIINKDVEKPVISEEVEAKSVLEKWVSEVMKGLKQFFYQGSLHGVKYIFEPTFGSKEKATWVIIMFISIFICAVVIIQLFCKWTSTPFVNVIDSVPTPIWAVPFPTVVICPHLHVKKSHADVSELKGFGPNRTPSWDNGGEIEFFASLVCPRMKNENKFMENRLTDDQFIKLREFVTKGAPTCSDVIKACNWPALHDSRWEIDKCCELFEPIFTNYGLCYAFNSLPLNAMTNETLSWHRVFNKNATPAALEWGLDIGYPKVFPPDLTMKPLRVMASGESNGLGVELFLNNSEHQYACEGNSLGFTILIASPTDHVYTSTVLRLPMDRMTTIEVTPLTYKTDSSLRALSPYKRQCFFQNEKRLQYYEFYTDSNCKHDLWVQEARNKCNCVLFHWPRQYISEPICTTKVDFNCISSVKAKVEEQLIYAYYAESEDERGTQHESKSCHPSCNDVIYANQVFYSDLTRENTSHKWGTFKLGEVTKINVHFYDDMFLGQHRHAQYDDYYFVGAIGGLLSLFLGFSIISVAELIYFVLLKPAYVIMIDISSYS
ncbi:pickpocket protein 28-like [Trichoplusia ni]|uniref:Pickpocket protein 28-like n=1 Tax=Trichoplusia ni TaxID=7111 RepID=A0A7E5W891_TRINI|nr:pickpocket protein 28-like [Trichoplusia ni]